jgi:hypothetical protein
MMNNDDADTHVLPGARDALTREASRNRFAYQARVSFTVAASIHVSPIIHSVSLGST